MFIGLLVVPLLLQFFSDHGPVLIGNAGSAKVESSRLEFANSFVAAVSEERLPSLDVVIVGFIVRLMDGRLGHGFEFVEEVHVWGKAFVSF